MWLTEFDWPDLNHAYVTVRFLHVIAVHEMSSLYGMKRHITFNIWRYENVSCKNLVDKDIIPTAAGLERSWYAWDEYSLVGIMSITLSYHRCNKQNNWADGLTCYQIQKIRTHPICCFAMGWAAAKQIHMMLIYRGHKFSCVMYYQMSQVSHLHKEWGMNRSTWSGLINEGALCFLTWRKNNS